MRKRLKIFLYTVFAIAISWAQLTLWVEREGEPESWTYGAASLQTTALIVYDPDPFYDLDKQVCISFGKNLAANGIYTTVATVAAARKLTDQTYNVYIFCANTYNWRPDRAISLFISDLQLENKNVVAITLGAGSTEASKSALERMISDKGGKIVDSRSLRLMRPNDESQLEQANVVVANSIATTWAREISLKMKSDTLKQAD
jgi:hypothetical protein